MPGIYKTGDYRLIPARTATGMATGDIEWPRDGAGNALSKPPDGIMHHYCPLALVDFGGELFTTPVAADCRTRFPALNALMADDVGYTNQNCLPDMAQAKTVQDALDLLCRNSGSSCALVAQPGPGWERIFDQIAEKGDAEICFGVGTYTLERPLQVRNKGHLKLSGCGPGTRLLAARTETVLRFENRASVTIRDLYAETGLAASNSERAGHLNGTLHFVDCPQVTLEAIRLMCGAGPRRMAACISVQNTTPAPNAPALPVSVRVQHCDLLVGHMQVGILLVNVLRAMLADNTIASYQKPGSLSFDRLLRDKRYCALYRRLLVSHTRGRGNLSGRRARTWQWR